MERLNSGSEKQKQLSTQSSLFNKTIILTEGEMKTFHNKEKLKEFMTTKPLLQKILEGLLHTEETRVRQEDSRKNEPL
jgi:hypothetical protein